MNQDLVKELRGFASVVICGQALSGCVGASVRDLAAAWPPDRLSNLVLATDASSSSKGQEEMGKA